MTSNHFRQEKPNPKKSPQQIVAALFDAPKPFTTPIFSDEDVSLPGENDDSPAIQMNATEFFDKMISFSAASMVGGIPDAEMDSKRFTLKFIVPKTFELLSSYKMDGLIRLATGSATQLDQEQLSDNPNADNIKSIVIQYMKSELFDDAYNAQTTERDDDPFALLLGYGSGQRTSHSEEETAAFIEWIEENAPDLKQSLDATIDQEREAAEKVEPDQLDNYVSNTLAPLAEDWLNVKIQSSGFVNQRMEMLLQYEAFREMDGLLDQNIPGDTGSNYRQTIRVLEKIYRGEIIQLKDKEFLQHEAPDLIEMMREIAEEYLECMEPDKADTHYLRQAELETRATIQVLGELKQAVEQVNQWFKERGQRPGV